jgi:hypothetical protein
VFGHPEGSAMPQSASLLAMVATMGFALLSVLFGLLA